MSKREDFIAFINALRSASKSITDEQRKGFLQLAVRQYGLSIEEATDILNASGLTIGEEVDYFQVLGLSISDFENRGALDIVHLVETAHKKLYTESLTAGGRPRADGRTEQQWRILLNQARDTLIEEQKRRDYNSIIKQERLLINKDTSPAYSDNTAVTLIEEANATGTDTEKPFSIIDNMVLIPAGEFEMGSNEPDAFENEKPIHSVYLDDFYIDQYPVTNAEFKTFVDANPQWRNLGWDNYQLIIRRYRDSDYLKNWFKDKYPSGKDDHPVNWVSWHAAVAYAKWVGKRLPTEAEWEKAARGGLAGQRFPWGNVVDGQMTNFDKRVGETTPIKQFPPNRYGLYDVVGNVYEWCLDRWDKGCYKHTQRRNPVAGGSIESIIDSSPMSKAKRVIRGGSWYSAEQELRVSYRDRLAPWRTKSIVGFRCVRSVNV